MKVTRPIKNMHGCDTVVECQKCGKRQFLNFENGLRNGWDECCGVTMPIIHTTADVKEAVRRVLCSDMKVEVEEVKRKPWKFEARFTMKVKKDEVLPK